MGSPSIEAAPAVTAPDERADLGVLFVHGIGEQAQGETLTQCAEPLIDWLHAWFHHDRSAEAIAAAPLAAALRPPLLSPGTPAHAELMLGRMQDGQAQAQRWLCAEAWWGPQVRVPSIADFTAWLLTRGSWVALFHLDRWWLAGRSPWVVGLLAGPTLLLWLVGMLLVNGLLLAAALIALLPVGAVRQTVMAALRAMTGVLGDAYVLLRHPLQRSAFEETTVRALRWLQPRCRRLVVVAHSQGAAVALGALRRSDCPEVGALVTVGAGIAKLHALRWFEGQGSASRVAPFLAGPLLLAGGALGLRARQLQLLDDGALWFGPGLLLAAGAMAALMTWRLVREAAAALRSSADELSLAAASPDFVWHDIAATNDPVPQGTLGHYVDGIPALQECQLAVLRSRFGDHTHYWQAKATFVPHLLDVLTQQAGATFAALQAAQDRLLHARRRRDFDLRVLRTTGALDVAALGLPLLLAWPRLVGEVARWREVLNGHEGRASPLRFVDAALRQFEDALQWLAALLTGDDGWASAARVTNLLVAGALILLALMLWRRLAFVCWEAWADIRTDEALRPRVEAPAGPLRDRLLAAALRTLMEAGLTVVLLAPFALATVWTLGPPELFSEAQLHRAWGQIVIGLLLVAVLLARVTDLAGLVDDWQDVAMRAWLAHPELAPRERLRAFAQALNEELLRRMRGIRTRIRTRIRT